MFIGEFEKSRKPAKVHSRHSLVIVGGGLTGVCCAITAARAGADVALIQDRPVLGGNASSEVRLWALGATSHMGNNNRWSREGGVIDEILVENTFRNQEGNPVLFDMVLIDKVLSEPNITLYLNTCVYDAEMSGRTVRSVTAFNPQTGTHHTIEGDLFPDCSGDGALAYMAGAEYRMGAEDREEYGEKFAPDKTRYGELLGHSILFYIKDTGRPVRFEAPEFALKEVEELIPRLRNPEYFSTSQHGCKYWWLEYGGRLDTIRDTEIIKFELWKIVYGVWNHIKNSGKYPETENYTLEWVGLFPGKRESRRFKGYYMLTQQDIIEQHEHYDAVSFGGWSIDLHPADGVYGAGRACNQWHSKGIYQIPYRCLVTPDADNLFIGGRIISVSHVANGSTRVMCTAAHGGQAIGTAAAIALRDHLKPADLIGRERIGQLQSALLRTGHFLPGERFGRGMLPPEDPDQRIQRICARTAAPRRHPLPAGLLRRRAYPGRRPGSGRRSHRASGQGDPADGRTAQFVAQGQLHPGHDRQAARFRPPGGRKQTDRRFRNALRSAAVRLHLLHGQSRRKHSDEFGDRLRPDFGIQHRQSRGLQFRQADSAGGHRGRYVRILVSKAPSRREKHRARILRAADLLRG